jgi:hypothetical protein
MKPSTQRVLDLHRLHGQPSADRIAGRHMEAGAKDWLQWIVQPAEVIWKHHKEFVYGPIDDAMDAIISELAPHLVKAIGEAEVDEDVDEFFDGAVAGKWDADREHHRDCPTGQTEDFCEGYEWGYTTPADVPSDADKLPPGVKRKVVEEALKDFRSRITEEVIERAMHKAWSAVSPAHTLKAIMHAVKKHGWKLGIGFALFEIVEHAILPAVLIAVTGHEELAIMGTIPIGEIIYAVIFRIMGRVPNEANKADPDGHLDWYESKYGPVRIASLQRDAAKPVFDRLDKKKQRIPGALMNDLVERTASRRAPLAWEPLDSDVMLRAVIAIGDTAGQYEIKTGLDNTYAVAFRPRDSDHVEDLGDTDDAMAARRMAERHFRTL